MKPDSLEYYIEKLDLRADGAYDQTLKNLRHAEERIAPMILRQFVERFEPQRMSLVQGVMNENGAVSLWWFMEEYALKGSVDEFIIAAATFFEEQDFQEIGKTSSALHYEKTEGKYTYEVAIYDFENYTGGPLCGGTVQFRITINNNFVEPSLGEILKIYPAVNSFVLPEKVEKMLLKEKFYYVSFGGTWEQYYSWSAEIVCSESAEAESKGRAITSLLLSAGYTFHEEKEDTRSFIFKDTEGVSFFHVTVDETNMLGLTFQPNS